MKFYLILLSILIFRCVNAQQGVIPLDRIYLNDSTTIYDGLIVEQAPAKYVKILRKMEKDTLQLLMKDIWKMSRVYPILDTLPLKAKPPKAKSKQSKNNYVFVEILGSAGVYSLNYDFRFNDKNRHGWGLRTGLAYLPVTTLNYSGERLKYHLLLFPFQVNYLFGKHKRFFDVGLGATYVIKSKAGKLMAPEYEYTVKGIGRRIPDVLGIISIGYRHLPDKGKIMWGISVTPLIGNSFTMPNIGFKIGYKIS